MRPRENPFRVDRLHSLQFRPQGFGWDDLLIRLAELDFKASIVGDDGSGKSTMLVELGERLEALGLSTRSICISGGARSFPEGVLRELERDLKADEIVLFDGGDHLGAIAWRRFRIRIRRARGIVITNHRESRLPTLVKTQTSPALLRDLVTELAPENGLPSEELQTLFDSSNGNLRDAMRALYDRCAVVGL